MNIFLIAIDELRIDCYRAHVVVAENETQVRELVTKRPAGVFVGDEDKEVWQTAAIENIGTFTGLQKEPFIVLSELNGG